MRYEETVEKRWGAGLRSDESERAHMYNLLCSRLRELLVEILTLKLLNALSTPVRINNRIRSCNNDQSRTLIY